MKRSNVQISTNVYVLRDEHSKDRRFMARIRGATGLRLLPRLTPFQRFELESGMYCSIHPEKRSELVFGRGWDGSQRPECRCTHSACRLYMSCDPRRPAKFDRAPDAPTGDEQPTIDGLSGACPPDPQHLGGSQRRPRPLEIDLGPDKQPAWRPVPKSPSGSAGSDPYRAVITHPIDGVQLVIAPPGAGKTYCVIERLKHLVDNGGATNPHDISVLCFTRAAVGEIRDRLQAESSKGNVSDGVMLVDVRTFDSFASRALYEVGQDMTGLNYDERIQLAIDLITLRGTSDLDHLIVDEVQDLVGVRARLVKALIQHRPPNCGFTLLGDPHQGIYDYQLRESGVPDLDSDGLLDWIREREQPELVEIGLPDNHRHRGRMLTLAEGARRLLTERRLADFFRHVDEYADRGVRHREHLLVIPEHMGRVAVLCRNNGQVLRVSRSLRSLRVTHTVRRQGIENYNPSWLFDLRMLGRATLGPDEFSDFISGKTPLGGELGQRLFEDLRLLAGGGSPALVVDDLMRALASGQSIREDVERPPRTGGVTVTTIHQAKGREYDTVLLMKSEPRDDDRYGEAKVKYVAITRARRALEHFLPDNTAWLKQLSDGRRFSERHRGGWLIGIEVGLQGDWDEESFVSDEVHDDADAIQTYIMESVSEGDEVTLKWHVEAKLYRIYHQDVLLGHMSGRFGSAVAEARNDATGSRWPMVLDRVYVQCVYTVVKKPETLGRHVPSPYFDTGVWQGVALTGLGRRAES